MTSLSQINNACLRACSLQAGCNKGRTCPSFLVGTLKVPLSLQGTHTCYNFMPYSPAPSIAEVMTRAQTGCVMIIKFLMVSWLSFIGCFPCRSNNCSFFLLSWEQFSGSVRLVTVLLASSWMVSRLAENWEGSPFSKPLQISEISIMRLFVDNERRR